MGYVASCGLLMVDLGRPRRLPLETLGTPRWTLIRDLGGIFSSQPRPSRIEKQSLALLVSEQSFTASRFLYFNLANRNTSPHNDAHKRQELAQERAQS